MSEHSNNQEQPSQEQQAATRTDEELFHLALTATDEDVEWEAISALHRRNSREVFEHARELCASEEAHKRRVGVDILAQLGLPDDHTFHDGVLAILLDMLAMEHEPEVLSSIASAMAHRHDSRAIQPLVNLKAHPDNDVRFSVVMGLLRHEDELAIQTLIELSTDSDLDVRNWATFGLGSQIDLDTPAIRAALVARLTDEDPDTRAEAMVGLARRHDPRLVEPLLADLEVGHSGSLLLEAAEEIGDPRLYPTLLRMRDEWQSDQDDYHYKLLEAAIKKCRPPTP